MHKLIISTHNPNADLKYFSSWLNSNHTENFTGFTNGYSNDLYLYFNTELTNEQEDNISVFYEGLTDTDHDDDAEMLDTHYKMRDDGQNYILEAKSKYFGARLKSGELTDLDIDYCYTRLHYILLRLSTGDWEPALYFMQNNMGTISQTDIDRGYTQDTHDFIINDLTNYINN